MSPSVEAQLRARLDFAHPLPLDGLTTYCGCSTAALAVATAGFISRGDLSAITKRSHARRNYVTNKALPDPDAVALSERMKQARAGVRWSDSPSAVRSRAERERLALKRQEMGRRTERRCVLTRLSTA
jgi:hypothetical protein